MLKCIKNILFFFWLKAFLVPIFCTSFFYLNILLEARVIIDQPPPIINLQSTKNSRMGKDRPASFYPIYGAIVILTVLALENSNHFPFPLAETKKKRDQDHTYTLLFQRLEEFLRQLAVNWPRQWHLGRCHNRRFSLNHKLTVDVGSFWGGQRRQSCQQPPHESISIRLSSPAISVQVWIIYNFFCWYF